ncbi:MMPL family transporter, partial [Paenibacillus sepulcri]|nr:MMPL family transporter [Paenibacillus sepulcri]
MGFHLLAVMSLRHPKIILLLWAVFLAFFGSFASRLPGVLQDHGLSPTGASEQVKRILAADFHIPEEPVILVFEKRASVSPEVFRRFIERTMQQLQAAEGVSQAWSPLDGAGRMRGNYAYALLSSDIGIGDRASVLEDLRSRLPVDRDMAVGITGKAAVQADVNQASEHDMRQAEAIGIPAAFIILLLAFGGIAAAVIPVMVGLTVVAGSMGIMYMAGTQIGLSNFVLNVIPMVGLALSIDFALMLVSRFREELTSGAVVEQAMITTMKSAGRAILYSALSVFFGLLGILFIPLPIFTTVAIGAMTVLVVSALAALT